MSGFAVIYHRDGRPIDADGLARMTTAAAHRGPDGITHWIHRHVGLGHCQLATTPEAVAERQPLHDPINHLCVTFAGRLDNRTELARAFREGGLEPVDDSDPALVLCAYRRWDTGCAAHLLGDFAFAVWDDHQQRLVCARDPLGKRPFCYALDGSRFLAASEIQQVLSDPGIPREPNEGMIAEHLASVVTDTEETLFRHVRRLPGGHTLVADRGHLQIARHWSPDPTREVRYGSDDEYAEALLGILEDAVACRCRAAGGVGAELSGGLDSTSVVSLACELRERGAVPRHEFETFSLVFPGLACDEQPFIDEAVRHFNVTASLCDGRTPLPTPATAGRFDLPFYPNGTMGNGLKSLAAHKGFRVLLTGLGGDDWLTGSPFHLADAIARFRFGRVVRELRENARPAETDSPGLPPSPLYRAGILPLVPPALRRAVRRIVRPPNRVPSWIPATFAGRTALVDRLAQRSPIPPFSTRAQRHIYALATSGPAIHGTEMEERLTALFGIEQRHPLDDRRVVEFALALPEEQRWRGRDSRVVLRHAMRGRLPEANRRRSSKAEFSEVVALAVLGLGDHPFEQMTLEKLGWVDGSRLRVMHKDLARLYRGGQECYPAFAWPLWMAHALERWYRAVFESP